MSTHFQTTIEASQSQVLLIAGPGVFTTQLAQAIEALHLQPIVIAPEQLRQASTSTQLTQILLQGYVCIWVDIPVFSDQAVKRRTYQDVFSILRYALHIPLIAITFDAFKQRKNGQEGSDPTSTTRWFVGELHRQLARSSHCDYQHVLYPYEGGVGIVQRYILEKIQAQNTQSLEGQCAPLWYTDVIEHIASLLYTPIEIRGVFEGKQRISLQALENELRLRSRHSGIGKGSGQFPFAFVEATPIGLTAVEKQLEELSLIVPKPQVVTPKDIHISTAVMVQNKVPKPKRKGTKILPILTAVVATFVMVYILCSIYFFLTFFQVRSFVQSFRLGSPTSVYTDQQLQSIQSKLHFLSRYTATIPFPYTMVGITLHSDRVQEGIHTMQSIVGGIATFEHAKQLLYTQITQSTQESIASSFEDSYQELSSVQAKLSQGDITLDLVFGIDGFSTQLLSNLGSYRDQISQQKAILSFLPELLGDQKPSTIALVSFDVNESRPLFGIPKEVVVLTLSEGKISTKHAYTAQELNSLLKGVIEPPSEMKAFTQVTNWKISDGAWSVDGPTSARQIAWFLSKQLHVEADGILLFNEAIIPKTLAALSTSEKAEKHQEIAGVLGIQTPPSILEVVEKIPSSESGGAATLFDQISPYFSSREAVLYLKDQAFQKTVQALSWDGSVLTPACPSVFGSQRTCVVSTRYFTEYDLSKTGENTAFLRPVQHQHDIEISQGNTLHTDTVLYPPLSQGTQEKMVKYLIDATAVLDSVTVNGITIFGGVVSTSQEFGKTTISFPVSLIGTQETRIVVTYTTPPLSPTQSSLAFFAQKQPGKGTENFTLSVHYAKEYTAQIIAPRALVEKQKVVFVSDLATSRLFAIGF